MRKLKMTTWMIFILAGTMLLLACAPVVAAQPAEQTPSVEQPANAEEQQPVQGQEAEQGQPADVAITPLLGEFATIDVKGNEVIQEIFAEKKLTMLSVWATFCGQCISSLPDMAALNAEYADQGFQVVGLLTDIIGRDGVPIPEQIELVNELVAKTGADYTQLAPSVEIAEALVNVTATPTTIFVDSVGNQVGEWYVGKRSNVEWQTIVEGLLAELPDTLSEISQPLS